MTIELEREEDGRWLTEIPELPGVMAYGGSQEEALAKVKALALRVMADRLELGVLHRKGARFWVARSGDS